MSEIKNESSALRYMTEQGIASGVNAQNFLQNKLREPLHGRYTQEQINRLHASGGPAVVNASDGAIPAGAYYDSQNPTKNQGEAKAGGFAAGKMSAEQIREKYGFEYNKEHAKASGGYSKYGGKENGAIYSTETGEYIGTVGGYQSPVQQSGADKPAEGIDAFEKIQDHELEFGFRDDKRSKWNTMNDVAGAVNNLYGQEQEAFEPKPEEENKPIEHSPELRQSINRVRTYENDVMSGKLSDDIFGSPSSYGNFSQGYSDKFDANKGAAGIGTAAGNIENNSSIKAADSFLDAKKTDVKKAYNFKPAGAQS